MLRIGAGVLALAVLVITPVASVTASTVNVPDPTLPIATGVMPRDPGRPNSWAWEPQSAVGPTGVLWAAGGRCPYADQHGSCGPAPIGVPTTANAPVWRSTDGGKSWAFVANPLALPPPGNQVQDRPGGYDPDIAAAPVARPDQPPVIAVVSLYGFTSALAVSADDGRTWAVAQSIGIPGQDRPWIGMAGTCELYLEYDPIVDLANAATVPRVERYDACAMAAAPGGQVVPTAQTSTLIEPATQSVTNGDQLPARIAIGRSGIYATYLTCDTSNTCTAHVGISRDRAASFSDIDLAGSAMTVPADGTFPLSAAADEAGHVAVAVTDKHHLRLWLSDDDGHTWRTVPGVDAPLGWNLANVPSVAVRGSTVALAWYGSPPSTGNQSWFLTVARSDDGARSFKFTWPPTVLATTAHDAPIADHLYDDFGTQIAPGGDISVVTTQSCVGHPTSDTECPGPPPGQLGIYNVVRWAWVGSPGAASAAAPGPAGVAPAVLAKPGRVLPATGEGDEQGRALIAICVIGTAMIARRKWRSAYRQSMH
jgi:hypothetical protein